MDAIMFRLLRMEQTFSVFADFIAAQHADDCFRCPGGHCVMCII